jgi:8-amino-7-oxononanoate synthase
VLWNDLETELERRESLNLRRVLRTVPEGVVDLASNDYLGLAIDPEVREAAAEAASQFGGSARASRLVSGNYALLTELENALATFKQTESSLVFSSGYAANLGLIAALSDSETALFCHKRNHASLLDACRLATVSGAKLRFYDTRSKLNSLLENSDARRKIVVADGVFSMDGDLLNLPETLAIIRQYDAYLILDDAHGTGTLGRTGRGVGEHFDLHDERIIWVGTLSKALGSQGGFVAGKRVLIDFLMNAARPFVYSTGLNPAAAGAALKALEIIIREPERMEKCRINSRVLGEKLRNMGFDAVNQPSPILPVVVGEADKALELSANLQSRGFWCPAIRFPTVPQGKARLRLTASAVWNDELLENVEAAFYGVRLLNRSNSPT